MKNNIIILIIAILFSLDVYGQDRNDFFTIVSKGDLQLTSEQSEKAERMIANSIYKNHYYVEIGELADLQQDGKIEIILPDIEDTLIFIPKEIEYNDSTNFIYEGELDTCNDFRQGYITIIADENDLFGEISVESVVFEIHDLGNRKNILFQIDPAYHTQASCSSSNTSPSGNINGEYSRNTQRNNANIQLRNGGCVVDVLVLYTSSAEEIADPQNRAQLFIRQSNEIARNSDADVRFNLVKVKELAGFEEDVTNIDETMKDLMESSQALGYRDLYDADIVVLLTDGNWWDNYYGGTILGSSNLDFWGNPDYAYNLVEIDAGGAPSYIFTHELTHNFGCKHSDDGRDQTYMPPFILSARGYLFETSWTFGIWHTERRTLHQILDSPYEDDHVRIKHLSNPEIEFKDEPTGTTERDNVTQVSDLACTIASYKDRILPMNIHISGPIKGTNSGTYTWCADITGCTEIESIVWEYSTDGFNYYPLQTGFLCFTGSLPYDGDVFFRITATCKDGQTDVSYHFVINTSIDRCGYIMEEALNSSDLSIDKKLKLAPNPVLNNLIIYYSVSNIPDVYISIFNISGKEVRQIVQEDSTKGIYQKNVDISDLVSGYYLVKYRNGQNVYSQSIIKQ